VSVHRAADVATATLGQAARWPRREWAECLLVHVQATGDRNGSATPAASSRNRSNHWNCRLHYRRRRHNRRRRHSVCSCSASRSHLRSNLLPFLHLGSFRCRVRNRRRRLHLRRRRCRSHRVARLSAIS